MTTLPRRKPGKYELVVTKSRPEDAPERLAIRTAELLTGIRNGNFDVQAFNTQAQAEKKKATDLTMVIMTLEDRKKDPPKKVSRMDPYATYDLDMCLEERDQYVERSKEYTVTAGEITERIAGYEQELLEVRAKLLSQRH